jgi:hypothetical protein
MSKAVALQLSRTLGWVLLITLLASPVLGAAFGPTSLQLIDRDVTDGKLTVEEAKVLRVQAVTRPYTLPEAYQSTATTLSRCGTEILLAAWQNPTELSLRSQMQLAAALARPSTSFFYDSPEGYFRIHYNTTGGHAVPGADLNTNSIPDYVENLALYADSSHKTEVFNYGYYGPPSDGSVGGSAAYDIYCQSIGAYGYASPESPGPQPWNDWTSYVVVHNTFNSFPPNTDPDGDVAGAAKATVAHEYLHSCQFAYDTGENGWWMEMTATWAEDEVFDLVNDNYNYLSGWFNDPQTSLLNNTPYGGFVWPRYISEVYGDASIEAIWDLCITTQALNAIESVLAGAGSSRDEAFGDFAAWNWMTGSRDDGTHYEEGNSYPLVPTMRTHSAYPVSTQTSSSLPAAMAANYIRFTTTGIPAGRTLALQFDGDDAVEWAAHIVAENGGGIYDVIPFVLDGNYSGSATLPNASLYTNVALVPANTATGGSGNYAYTACIGPLAPDLLSPADGATAGTPVQLDWDAIAGALSYSLQVDLDPGFGSPEVDSVLSGFSASIEGLTQGAIYYWRVSVTDDCSGSDWSTVQSFRASCGVVITGDVDVSGAIEAADIIIMVNYLFKGGPEPQPIAQAGDVNCDGVTTSADIIDLVNHVFKSGATPCDVCSIL